MLSERERERERERQTDRQTDRLTQRLQLYKITYDHVDRILQIPRKRRAKQSAQYQCLYCQHSDNTSSDGCTILKKQEVFVVVDILDFF